MKRVLITIVALATLSLASCTDAQRAKTLGFGGKHKVELIGCDGTVIKTWIASGKVLSEQNSDGYYFNDVETGKLIEVTGTIVITQQ